MRSSQKCEGSPGGGPTADEDTKCTDIVAAPTGDDNEQKVTATLIAKFALQGFAVHRLECGNAFLVCRWNLAQYCPDVAALRAFARRVGLR
jgi:hypothetical protein